MILAALVLAGSLALSVAAGCSTSSASNRPAQPSSVSPDIEGYVASIWGISEGRGSGDVLGSILIEGELGRGMAFDRASVAIREGTRIYDARAGEPAPARFEDLEVGQRVQAVFTGPVAESYPVQAAASRILILESTAIGEVMDRHRAALLSIEGVVGLGIASRDGKPVIVVYLENHSPELEERVPAELEGFRIVTEATGPIEAQPE
jgi:hypothetical protein